VSRPVVGVTGPEHYRWSPAWVMTKLALLRVGARAVRLPPHGDPERVRELDGVVVGGGADVHPSLFGQPVLADAPSFDRERDRFELTLLRLAWDEGVPVLAICRGLQLMNVVFGGTLDQNVWQAVEGDTRNTPFAKHPVRVARDGILRSVVRRDRIKVNRIHRQAVEDLGEGLRVTARGLADVPQAIEPREPGRWWLGVQWHPEYLVRHRIHQRLFRRFRQRAWARRCRRDRTADQALATFERMENA
jgi:putative glutamine amidotransferase